MKTGLISWLVSAWLITLPRTVVATYYVSNLGNVWPHEGSIGDLHAVNAGNAIVGRFTTGAQASFLNFVSIELLLSTTGPGRPGPQPWANMNIQLYQRAGAQYSLLRTFVNPTINPAPTQWPVPQNIFYTAYVDFKPNGSTTLNPFTEYAVSVGVNPGGTGYASAA